MGSERPRPGMLTGAAPPLIAAAGLDVGRRGVLLPDVRLAVRAGESWFILGRNGAGKTSLLLSLLGLLPPLRGRVEAAPRVRDRTGLGYVPQSLRFAASLPATVAEFVRLGLCGLALTPDRAAARVHAALTTMQLAPSAERVFATLSIGQQRRALVARALARQPALLVLDEPTANLDPHGEGLLAADLEAQRAQAGVALLHASHDLRLARQFATHVALVHDGTVAVGEAGPMLASAALRDALGVAP